jgi:heme exporter protein A
VALARLWLGEARLWVLDEPFTALDVEAAALLERHIEGHLAGDGMVVLTTHQQLGIGAGRVHVLTLS